MADELEISLTGTRVRKWGRMKVGISDYGAKGIAVPTANADLFDLRATPPDVPSYKPTAFPAGVKELGYLMTSGIVDAKSVSSNTTQMLQSLTPVRTDVESIEQTVQMVFGEANAYTAALRAGLPVSEWAASKDDAWAVAEGEAGDLPWYVLWLQGVDGIGTNAIYRYEIGLRCQVTAFDNRTMNRSDPESFGVTFGLFLDPITKKSYVRAEDGPGYTNHLAVTPSLPS